ncbi:high-affinity Zn(2+) transporter [Saccharomycopsis crataegensis]|uniref:High-affinity Zn(2+) transporter n=1 Tax=Saccharomycopsis crataegensis TaxID=43959 RepID=A0AAV5QE06_9ASCO|nr:high-affinity Zn(2+) transporter [Saccharomycopsis crataegensis]
MVNWGFSGDVDEIFLTDENVSDAFKTCVLQGFYDAGPAFTGGTGTRIGSIFVILIVSTFVTLLPLLCKRHGLRVPLYFYLFARYFGAGVIVATAFVHLMDPAYGEIGPNTCVGGWGNWAVYSWPPALILVSVFSIFLVELVSEVYVERKYGCVGAEPNVEKLITGQPESSNVHSHTPNHVHGDIETANTQEKVKETNFDYEEDSVQETEVSESGFKKQIAAFLMLEFGVIFHSVIIGLNLGSTDYDEFKTLYIVLVFHQSFEGLGIGARLSAIEWPKEKSIFLAYALCIAYGLVTPISVAIGLGVRNSYASDSFTASIVSGVLDSLSAGILIYTGLVELLARDFIFNDEAKQDLVKLSFNIFCTLLGALLMALIGKWA